MVGLLTDLWLFLFLVCPNDYGILGAEKIDCM